MIRLQVRHRTTYRYAHPVQLDPHRFVCRPRDTHELRVLDAQLTVSPQAETRWTGDVFGNSVLWLHFSEPTSELVVESRLEVEHYPGDPEQLVLEPQATTLPLVYTESERVDLAPYLHRHYEDPENALAIWARRFVRDHGADTLATLAAINTAIRDDFQYQRRDETGTWAPSATLSARAGSCRDFALLMMEAVRSLGLAARFVSGYLYDGSQGGGSGKLLGAGETHAWLQVYLPGEGWVAYDPTNALVAGNNLIEVAVTRDPEQAVPLAGSFVGQPDDALGMTVEVTITEL
ncbi:MAG: transglutaminase family protein [Stagnimonas sp.]|nr:transglutaminase family protein [Stagnimonas sp.]